MASYARNHDRFTDRGLGIVAVCVDDMERNHAMVEKLILPFPILSDPEREVIRGWGVDNEPERIAHPAIFVVRPDGRIALQYIGTDFEDRPSNQQVLAAVSEAH